MRLCVLIDPTGAFWEKNMYISVENYEEIYLKGKDSETVLEEIEKIRREIAKAKTKLESPANVYDTYPRDESVIDICRKYLASAMKYYSDLTGKACELSEEEKASAIFNSTVSDVSCITLTVGRYLQDKYELTFGSDSAEICEIHLEKEPTVRAVDRKHAMDTVLALNMGEWKESYTPDQYGCTLNEPTKWQIRIDYSGKESPRFFDGFGVFPYNFEVLLKLLGADID